MDLEYRDRDVRIAGPRRAGARRRARGGRPRAGPSDRRGAPRGRRRRTRWIDGRPEWPAGARRAGRRDRSTWTVAEGVVAGAGGRSSPTGDAVRHALLLETDPDGRFSHLELARRRAAGPSIPRATARSTATHVRARRARGPARRRAGRFGPDDRVRRRGLAVESPRPIAWRAPSARGGVRRSEGVARRGPWRDRARRRRDSTAVPGASVSSASRPRRLAGRRRATSMVIEDAGAAGASWLAAPRGRWSSDDADSWTGCGQGPPTARCSPRNSWISPYRAPRRPAIVGLARRGPRPKAVSQMQISGVDYGPAVPSGVSVCPARPMEPRPR